MGSQFSAEFLLGYRAGHRDGFGDAVQLMRDAATVDGRTRALARREDQLRQLLSGNGLLSDTLAEGKRAGRARTADASFSKESAQGGPGWAPASGRTGDGRRGDSDGIS